MLWGRGASIGIAAAHTAVAATPTTVASRFEDNQDTAVLRTGCGRIPEHSPNGPILRETSMSLRSLAVLLLSISFTACASAPPAAPPAPVAVKADQPRTVELLCGEGARYVSFDKLGIPSQE